MFARSSPVDPVIVVGAGLLQPRQTCPLYRPEFPSRLSRPGGASAEQPCAGGIGARVLQRFPYLVRALSRIAAHSVFVSLCGLPHFGGDRNGALRCLAPFVERDLAARAVRSSPSVSTIHRRACDHEIDAEPRDSIRIQRYLFADGRRIARLAAGAHREGAAVRLLLLSFVRDCLSTGPLRSQPGITGI